MIIKNSGDAMEKSILIKNSSFSLFSLYSKKQTVQIVEMANEMSVNEVGTNTKTKALSHHHQLPFNEIFLTSGGQQQQLLTMGK